MRNLLGLIAVGLLACGGTESNQPAATLATCNGCLVAIGGDTLTPGTCMVLGESINGSMCCSCSITAAALTVTFNGDTGIPASVNPFVQAPDPFAAYVGVATQQSSTTFTVAWTLNGAAKPTSALVGSQWLIGTTPLKP